MGSAWPRLPLWASCGASQGKRAALQLEFGTTGPSAKIVSSVHSLQGAGAEACREQREDGGGGKEGRKGGGGRRWSSLSSFSEEEMTVVRHSVMAGPSAQLFCCTVLWALRTTQQGRGPI